MTRKSLHFSYYLILVSIHAFCTVSWFTYKLSKKENMSILLIQKDKSCSVLMKTKVSWIIHHKRGSVTDCHYTLYSKSNLLIGKICGTTEQGKFIWSTYFSFFNHWIFYVPANNLHYLHLYNKKGMNENNFTLQDKY